MVLGNPRSRSVLAVLSVISAVLAAEPSAAQTAADSAAGRGSWVRAAPEPIRLRPGDAIRVEVRDDPGMGGEFQVGEDGAVLIPVIGVIPVAGRAFDEVSADVRAAYGRELADPVLRVVPLVRVAVLGEVIRPALLPVDPTYTVGDVLALAGGLTPLADRDEIVLVRRDGERIPLSLDPGSEVLMQPLRSGDRIVVGRKSWLSQNLAIFVGAAASVAAAAVTSLIVR